MNTKTHDKHDVGKTETRTVDPDGRIRFFGHETRGAVIAENICRRLKMSVKPPAALSWKARPATQPMQV